MAQWDLDYPWTLDTYGRAVYRTYNVQKHEVDIAGYNLTMAREALKERVRSAYHDIRGLEEQEAALQTAVKTARDGLRVVQAQCKVGLVARDKLREAEAALAEKQADLYSLKCQHAARHSTEGRANNCRESGRLAKAFHVRGKRGRFFKLSAGVPHWPPDGGGNVAFHYGSGRQHQDRYGGRTLNL